MGYQPDPIFLQKCPTEVKALFSGENLYMAQVRLTANIASHYQPRNQIAIVAACLWLRGCVHNMAPQVRSRRLGEAVGEQSDNLRREAEAKAEAEAQASKSKSS